MELEEIIAEQRRCFIQCMYYWNVPAGEMYTAMSILSYSRRYKEMLEWSAAKLEANETPNYNEIHLHALWVAGITPGSPYKNMTPMLYENQRKIHV